MPTDSGRSTKLEDTGFIVLSDEAMGWDDIQVSVSSARLPASSAPNWTTYDFGIAGGVAFNVLGYSVNEYQDIYIQTSHAMALQTILDNHIHWTIPSDSAGSKFKFQLDVIAAGIGEMFAAVAGSPFTPEKTLAGDESGRHNLFDLAEIPGVNTTVSTCYIMRMKRIAASSGEYGSPVYVIFNDSHYKSDTPAGSRAEDSK